MTELFDVGISLAKRKSGASIFRTKSELWTGLTTGKRW
jgi:hypothetical protein